MKTNRPRGLDARRARQLLARAKPHRAGPARVEALSASLLGGRLEAHGLVGSAEVPEELVAPLDRFDCVTFVETVLALARAADPAGFVDELRRIRYDGGQVEWAARNHYMTEWVRRNGKTRVVKGVPAGPLAARRVKPLDAVPGLPPRRARLSSVPKARLKAWEPRLKNGDVVLFASTRPGLDVFHCGFLVRERGRWKLRHASRTLGRVADEDLSAFLRANRMAGLIVARPLDGTGCP